MNIFVQVANNIVVARIMSEESIQQIRNRLGDESIFNVTANTVQPYVGWVYENGSYNMPDALTLDDIKASKLDEINSKAAILYNLGFYSNATGTRLWYDSDKDSQDLINRQQLLALNNPTVYKETVFAPGYGAGVTPIRARSDIRATQADKSIQLLDAKKMIILGNDLLATIYEIKTTNWMLQEAVVNAATVDEVNAIEWPRLYA